MAVACADGKHFLKTALYISQKESWPKQGKHILAQYDDSTVVVYQAFKPSIAQYAIQNQRFGGDFSLERMSWIKTNFLWMMYRCGWATKHNQECVLAIEIRRQHFETILKHAYTVNLQKSLGLKNADIHVRLQWDPDHNPHGDKLARRAIQLGLKGEILMQYATQWIVKIYDITDFVTEQYQILCTKGEDHLLMPKEQVYPLSDLNLAKRIELDV